jgi:hypothetical protein
MKEFKVRTPDNEEVLACGQANYMDAKAIASKSARARGTWVWLWWGNRSPVQIDAY